MRILIAPNAFKNSLNAADVADCIAAGLQQSELRCSIACFPVADGGDGTCELLVKKMKGEMIRGHFHGPLGTMVDASFGLIDNQRTAVIEMASASGIRLLSKNELDPLRASSAGTGEMINAALDLGVGKIILTLGGSATVDGGCGILHALGVRFSDAQQNHLRPVPGELFCMKAIDIAGLDKRIVQTHVELWCDVKTILLGEDGAAAVFAPQKGANDQQVIQLEHWLRRLSDLTKKATGRNVSGVPSGGAAGGTAAFLHAFLNAEVVDGATSFLAATGFYQALDAADLVITGEGTIDLQTLDGKAPFAVASASAEKKIPAIALAGKISDGDHPQLHEIFAALFSISNRSMSLDEAIRLTAPNLQHTALEIGNLLALDKNRFSKRK